MKSRSGFTLIELMVVILIVGIIAAAAVPVMRGRIDSSKWTEGKTALSTIRTALCMYATEKGSGGNYGKNLPTLQELGFTAGDLQGRYFDISNYEIEKTSFKEGKKSDFKFKIKATAPEGITSPSEITLDEKGKWTVKNGGGKKGGK